MVQLAGDRAPNFNASQPAVCAGRMLCNPRNGGHISAPSAAMTTVHQHDLHYNVRQERGNELSRLRAISSISTIQRNGFVTLRLPCMHVARAS